METPLNASSTSAGGLISGNLFEVPQFQREYAWELDEVEEFFGDLRRGLGEETYFLGLIILTGGEERKVVVDGQQRLLSLTLLAAVLYHEALRYDRRALADRLHSNFLRAINFETDEEIARMSLSSSADDATLRMILENPAADLAALDPDDATTSGALIAAYRLLSRRVQGDLSEDPFKRLGAWADFLTNKLYMAVFVHPDPGSAYKVFEVVNTRGKVLTTADLLKSYVLSQTPEKQRQHRYEQWQDIAVSFRGEGAANLFVQFIRHSVTLERGHVLPRDLYDVLSGRGSRSQGPMSPEGVISLLRQNLSAYMQMLDPTTSGPANEEQTAIFAILTRLNVIAVRPILLAMLQTENATAGMQQLLKLVVRRIVVGNLGTGNVERRFGQTARRIASEGSWELPLAELEDLNPPPEDFRERVHHRSMNLNVLSVLRQSVLQARIAPDPVGYLYLIRPRNADWDSASPDRVTYWVSTIGNSLLANVPRRPSGTASWDGFRERLLPLAVEHEWVDRLQQFDSWDIEAIEQVGADMAARAVDVWY